jgi:hypothetical protein
VRTDVGSKVRKLHCSALRSFPRLNCAATDDLIDRAQFLAWSGKEGRSRFSSAKVGNDVWRANATNILPLYLT